MVDCGSNIIDRVVKKQRIKDILYIVSRSKEGKVTWLDIKRVYKINLLLDFHYLIHGARWDISNNLKDSFSVINKWYGLKISVKD